MSLKGHTFHRIVNERAQTSNHEFPKKQTSFSGLSQTDLISEEIAQRFDTKTDLVANKLHKGDGVLSRPLQLLRRHGRTTPQVLHLPGESTQGSSLRLVLSFRTPDDGLQAKTASFSAPYAQPGTLSLQHQENDSGVEFLYFNPALPERWWVVLDSNQRPSD